jgi:hypothetical protein
MAYGCIEEDHPNPNRRRLCHDPEKVYGQKDQSAIDFWCRKRQLQRAAAGSAAGGLGAGNDRSDRGCDERQL